jgi:hypothetical protein
MSVFGRRPRAEPEYRLYAKVSTAKNTVLQTIVPLTDDDFIEESNCTYQSIWNDKIHPHFKAGLLLCQRGFKVEYGDMLRNDNTGRDMLLIPCEAGLCHYAQNSDMKWTVRNQNVTPANYVYLSWGQDQLFTTTAGTAIQLKVVDAHPPDAAHSTIAMKRRTSEVPSHPHAQLADMRTLLHQMSLHSTKM